MSSILHMDLIVVSHQGQKRIGQVDISHHWGWESLNASSTCHGIGRTLVHGCERECEGGGVAL